MLEQKTNCVPATSLGRLFDGVAALSGLHQTVNFEGQAAMMLESAAGNEARGNLPVSVSARVEILVIEYGPMITELMRQIRAGAPLKNLAQAFHAWAIQSLTAAAVQIACARNLDRVVLSGGCFQNRLLLAGCIRQLEAAGLHVYSHQVVPAGDGGISLGQAYVAACQAAC